MCKGVVILVTITVIAFLPLVSSSIAESNVASPNSDTACVNNICKTTIYSYERYWKEGNDWEQIDESFFDCSSSGGDVISERYCTNEYHYKVEADGDGEVSVSYKGDSYTMKLNAFDDKDLEFDSYLDNGILVYEVIPNEVELRYQYLADHLKEEVVVYNEDKSFVENGLHLSFETSGNVDPLLAPAFVCDSNQTCMDLQQSRDSNNIDINIPAKFFQQDLVYPLVVDPTVTFDANFASWNGYIRNETNQSGSGTSNYTRFSNPSSLITLSIGGAIPDGYTRYHHGVIEWNVSSIPDGSVIYNATLQLRVEPTTIGSPVYNVSLFELDHTHDYYADEYPTCQGNCQFYIDAVDGSTYANEELTGKTYHNFTLSNGALTDIESSLSSGVFRIGIDTDYWGDIGVGSKDHSNSAKRPVLTLVYGVNASDSDDAIRVGINNSLPSNPSTENQKIYVVNELGQRYLATFDRIAVFNNQTWAFNYRSPGEDSVNMPSLFRALNIWENQSLSYIEIVSQVGGFINATIY